jgi:hypothetical protein
LVVFGKFNELGSGIFGREEEEEEGISLGEGWRGRSLY